MQRPTATNRCSTTAADASGVRAAGGVAWVVAQLRWRRRLRERPGDRAAGVRSRRHALRSGQQLRPAARLGRGELRPDAARRSAAVPRRAGHLHEGRLLDVARAVRRMGLAEVPALESRSKSPADGPRIRRHLLLASARSRHAVRRNDGRARIGSAAGQGAATSACRTTRPSKPARPATSSIASASIA